MTALRLLAMLALCVALLLVTLSAHPLRFTHASFRDATCVCPVCWINDGVTELSIAEYC